MSFCWYNCRRVFLLLLALCECPVQAVIWEQCLIDIQMHHNAEEYVKNRTLFHTDSTPENPILTLYGCTSLCGGSGRHWYPDPGSIINTWILPALVILTQKAVHNGSGLWDAVHILSNPIHWFVKTLQDIDEAQQCFDWGKRSSSEPYSNKRRFQWLYRRCFWLYAFRYPRQDNGEHKAMIRGTYLYALKTAGQFDIDQAKELDRRLMQELTNVSKLTPEDVEKIQYEIGEGAANCRGGRLSLALLAIFLYIWQAVSSFVQAIGGNWTTVPGGRIGLAMFWQWIVCAVLISNLVGGFANQEFCLNLVEKTVLAVSIARKEEIEVERQEVELRRRVQVKLDELIQSVEDEMPTAEKFGQNRRGKFWRYFRSTIIVLLASSPVLGSSAGSLAVLWFLPPRGPNCRFFLLISISSIYVLNAVLTSIFKLPRPLNKIKDLFITLGTTALIFLAASGFYNTCSCWSGWNGIYHRGLEDSKVYLNSAITYRPLLQRVYPVIFSCSFFFQFGYFYLMGCFGFDGLSILQWTTHPKIAGGWLKGLWNRFLGEHDASYQEVSNQQRMKRLDKY